MICYVVKDEGRHRLLTAYHVGFKSNVRHL